MTVPFICFAFIKNDAEKSPDIFIFCATPIVAYETSESPNTMFARPSSTSPFTFIKTPFAGEFDSSFNSQLESIFQCAIGA